MPSGRRNQLTQQIGEYLVSAELARRGVLATPFSGNVPGFDLVAVRNDGTMVMVQVKAARQSWQFTASTFLEIAFEKGKQVVVRDIPAPLPTLVEVFVKVGAYGEDRFFIFTEADLYAIVARCYRSFLDSCGGVRKRKPESRHTALRADDLARFENQWGLIVQEAM